jgi:hypothetical protein
MPDQENSLDLEEEALVQRSSSERFSLGRLIVSVRESDNDAALLILGRPGFPNVERRLRVGDVALFETPDQGLLEVRLMSSHSGAARVLVTRISPRRGIAAGFTDIDPANAPFEPDELARIRESLDQVRQSVQRGGDLRPEQFDYLSRKLDEMSEAAERLGRKDWMNLAIGTLTGVVISAALDTPAAKLLFQAADSALSWLFAGTLKLLQ